MAIAHRAHEIRSPVDRSMSISRGSGWGETSWAMSIRSSVVLPRAERTATTRLPRSRWATIRRAACLIRSALATEVPPNFMTIVAGAGAALPSGVRAGLGGTRPSFRQCTDSDVPASGMSPPRATHPERPEPDGAVEQLALGCGIEPGVGASELAGQPAGGQRQSPTDPVAAVTLGHAHVVDPPEPAPGVEDDVAGGPSVDEHRQVVAVSAAATASTARADGDATSRASLKKAERAASAGVGAPRLVTSPRLTPIAPISRCRRA